MSTRTVSRKKPGVRRLGGREFSFSEQDVQAISQQLGEPAWLTERRLQAWKTYQSLPMPSMSDEAWRRTDIRSLPADQVRLWVASEIPVDSEIMEPLLNEEHGALIIQQPGKAPFMQIPPALEQQGVIFTDWSTAARKHAGLLKQYLGSVIEDGEGKFSALAASVAELGIFLYIPAGLALELPLHSILWAPGPKMATFSRLLVVVEDGASATFVHESASKDRDHGHAVHAGIVELWVGKGASLQFVELQNWDDGVWNFTHERALTQQDGSIDWVFGAVGSRLTKNFTEITLAGRGAEGRMSGFYFADGKQHLDHDTQQNHMAENTSSDLLFKGALLGNSRSVWRGMIHVAPGALGTDGYQANRNLILDRNARADSIPGLEILADDVRCTHGATVGQLEDEPVYYLMSRGLPRKEAERLVVNGFFAPIMDRIPFDKVRERFQHMIDQKMRQI